MYFFGGLSTDKEEAKKTLTDHFPLSEDVDDDDLYNYQNICGIGAVKLDSEDLTPGNRDIDGKKVLIAKAPIIFERSSNPDDTYTTTNSRRIHVADLPLNIQEEDLNYYFSVFGDIEDIEIKHYIDKWSTEETTMAYVVFDDEESVIEASKLLFHTICGCTVRVQPNVENSDSEHEIEPPSLSSSPHPPLPNAQPSLLPTTQSSLISEANQIDHRVPSQRPPVHMYNFYGQYGTEAVPSQRPPVHMHNFPAQYGTVAVPSQRPPVHMPNFPGPYGTVAVRSQRPPVHMYNVPGPYGTVAASQLASQVIPSMQQLGVGQYARQSIQEGHPSQGFPGASSSGHSYGRYPRG